MRILIVEDDEKIGAFVSRGLREAGYAVYLVADGRKALASALSEPYAAAVVDLGLPGLDGLSLIDELRKRGSSLPVLILSARRSLNERVKGLTRGGDDYLTKPFAFSELLARVQALVRRSSSASEPTSLTRGDLTLDLLSREVRRAGRLVELQPREFSLLECLMRRAGTVASRTVILERVWNYDFDPQTNAVDVLVSRLRAKLGPGVPAIETLRGLGYVLR